MTFEKLKIKYIQIIVIIDQDVITIRRAIEESHKELNFNQCQ